MLISSEKKLQQKYKQSNLYGKLSKAKKAKRKLSKMSRFRLELFVFITFSSYA